MSRAVHPTEHFNKLISSPKSAPRSGTLLLVRRTEPIQCFYITYGSQIAFYVLITGARIHGISRTVRDYGDVVFFSSFFFRSAEAAPTWGLYFPIIRLSRATELQQSFRLHVPRFLWVAKIDNSFIFEYEGSRAFLIKLQIPSKAAMKFNEKIIQVPCWIIEEKMDSWKEEKNTKSFAFLWRERGKYTCIIFYWHF